MENRLSIEEMRKHLAIDPETGIITRLIGYNGKRKHLGYFRDLDLAAEFRELASAMIHGEFASNRVRSNG